MVKKLGGRKTFSQRNLNKVPKKPGIYLIRNAKGNAQYVGMTKSLRTRIGQHASQDNIPGAQTFQVRTTGSASHAERLEKKYIKQYNPRYNIQKHK